MSNNKIEAHKITKPIQLLAAWLVGLAIVNATFLGAAATITQPDWIPVLLSVAAVINVPIFVVSIFLLQTKFRPEMQEDSYYSDYLNNKNDASRKHASLDKPLKIEEQIESLSNKLTELIQEKPENINEKVMELISDDRVEELCMLHADSRSLSELFIRPEYWATLVDDWGKDPSFISDYEELLSSGLIVQRSDSIKSATLSNIGKKVAKQANIKELLFYQTDFDYFYNEGVKKSNKAVK